MNSVGKLATRLVVMYAIALCAVAVAVVGAYGTLQWGLSQQEHNAIRINLSGRQRMLAERIVLHVTEWSHADSSGEAVALEQEVLETLDLFELSHENLVHGGDLVGLHSVPPLSSAAIYFGPQGLSERIPVFAETVHSILATGATGAAGRRDSSSGLRRLHAVVDERLHSLLDEAVRAEQIKAEQDVVRLRLLEAVILGAMLILLCLEAVFIFLPTIRIVRATIAREREKSEELRRQIVVKDEALLNLSRAKVKLEKLSLIPQFSGDAVILLDRNGCIDWINDTFTEMLGWSLDEVRGRRPADIFKGVEVLEDFEKQVRAEALKSSRWRREIQIRTKQGVQVWVDIGINFVEAEEGHASRFIAVLRDITDTVGQREALERSNAKADAANRSKSQFLANMSHEIRTPMNGIMGMNYLLLSSGLDEDQKEYAQTVQASSEHLLAVINNILDLSKLEAGEVELADEVFDLRKAVDMSIDAVRGVALQKELALLTEWKLDGLSYFCGDADRLRQVLINVLGNAVKFTEEGEIALSVRDCNGEIEFCISDPGAGIPADQVPHLFDRFYQADGTSTRTEEGAGLGLAICKEIIDRMKGTISVTSEPGVGTRFTIRVPLERSFEALPVAVEQWPGFGA